jgi:uncharacterized membrane protein
MPEQKQTPGSGSIRKLLVRGLFVILPGALTLWVVTIAFGMTDAWLGPAVDAFVRLVVPQSVLVGPFANGHIPGLTFIVLLLALVLLGGLTSFSLGATLFRKFDALIVKLPGAGAIYKGARKIGDLFTGPKELPFQRVVIIPFMGAGRIKSLGFVTGRTVDSSDGVAYLRVAVPTPPNPVSCILVLVPEADAVDAGMTVEEGLQFCMSLGMVGPAEMALSSTRRTGGGGN